MAPSSNDDWLNSLARQATTSDTARSAGKKKAKRKGCGNDELPSITSRTKAERIKHRQEKKAKRQERKQRFDEERQARQAKKKSKQQNSISNDLTTTPGTSRKGLAPSSKKALVKLSNTFRSISSQQPPIKGRHKQDLINGVPPPPKGKATKQSTINPTSSELQPRTRDYNGQGLARPSLYLPLNDAAFIPRLEEEFAEHIPGFFGKSKTASVKKQKGEEMLWKQRLEEKQNEAAAVGGKKKKRRVDMI